MHRHGRIAQHGFRPRGGNGDVRRLARLGIDHRILEMPEMALDRLVKNLVVADGRLQKRVPVHEPFAAIDFALLEEVEERLADRPGADLIEREPGPLPVATTAHLLQLADDAGFVVGFPLPDAIDQARAAQLVPAELLLAQQPSLDDRLRGDAGMVGAGHPQGLESLHPFLANENVLQRVVQGVAEVQRAGHVGRRDDDAVGLAAVGSARYGNSLVLPRKDTIAVGRRRDRIAWAVRSVRNRWT